MLDPRGRKPQNFPPRTSNQFPQLKLTTDILTAAVAGF
jgi:hypothetical protein